MQASAGTGKTFAIEHIFVRLLLEQSKKIECENILVVTFTNAATRELKSRIHAAVETALGQLLTNKILLPYLMDLDEGTRLTYIKSLEKAILNFDKAQIFTIHSFCFHALKTKGFDAFINLDMGEIGEISYKDELKQTLLDTLLVDVDKDSFGHSEIHHLLKSCKGDIHLLVAKVFKLVESELDYEVLEGFKELADTFNMELKRVLDTYSIGSLEEAFLQIAPLFKGLCNVKKEVHPEYLEQLRLLEKFSKEGLYEGLFDEIVYRDSFFLEKFLEENVKKKAEFSENLAEYKDLFFLLNNLLVPPYKKAKDPNKTLLKLAKACQNRIEKEYDKGKIFSFDAYLRLMLEALQNKKFKEKVASSYHAAIIDEFQDTDPVQWKIFKTLFAEDDFPLYLVGDPKQSIYAFRNADLPTYLEASSCFSKESKQSLDTNYRSEPALVGTLNDLFSKDHAKNWLSSSGSIEYTEVKPSHFFEDTVFEDEGKHVHAVIFEEKKSRDRSFPSKALEDEELFPYIASEIFKIKDQKETSFSDIAILIRDRYQGQRLERALSKYNIPLQIKSHSPLYQTKAFAFFQTLMTWLNSPNDKNLLKTLLVHPYMGFCHRDLKLEEESLSAFDAICKLKDLSDVFDEKGFLTFYQTFLKTSFANEVAFEKILLKGGSAEDYQDLCQIYEVLIAHVNPPYFIQDILFFLEECTRKKEDESFMQKGIAKEDAVIVMTTHLSKGLEFSYVFALGVASRSQASENILRMKDTLEVFDESSKEHQSYLQNINEEKMRQLYVALTRAKKRVYLFFCLDEEGREIPYMNRSAMEHFCKSLADSYQKKDLLQKLNGINTTSLKVESHIESRELKVFERKKKVFVLAKPKEYHKKSKERIFGSYSAFVKSRSVSEEKIKQEEGTKNVFSLPSSKETGNLLHAILEKVFERGLYIEKSQRVIKALIEQEVQGSHLDEWKDVIYLVIENVMHLKLSDGKDGFALSDIKLKDVTTEMPFHLYEDEIHTIKGFIDLCIIADGRMYLLDWKSNFLGNHVCDYEEKNLVESMKHHDYFLQAKFYSRAIRSFVESSDLEYGGMFYVYLRGLKKETAKGVYFVS